MAVNIIKMNTDVGGDLARVEQVDGTPINVLEISIDCFDGSKPMTALLRVEVNELRTEEVKEDQVMNTVLQKQ